MFSALWRIFSCSWKPEREAGRFASSASRFSLYWS